MNSAEREAAIRDLFPLVLHIAKRVARMAHLSDHDDLVGDGCVGLIRAVDSFDPERGTSFVLYARRLIVGAMLNGLRQRDPVSERVRRTMRRAEERRFRLAQELGTLPSLGELEREDPHLRRARLIVYSLASISLDAPVYTQRDPLTDVSEEPAARALERDRTRQLHEAIALLPERQQRVLALHYAGEESLHTIGATLRVSPQRVSQLHLQALARLRETVARP